MSILVTGGNGFIGRRIVRELVARGEDSPIQPNSLLHTSGFRPDF